MNKEYYDFLGLSEGATEEEINAKYAELKARFTDDMFLEGERGNDAARNLNKLEKIYKELIESLHESTKSHDGGVALKQVGEAIRADNLDGAQRLLDGFDERSAEWHYLQSVVFYKKNWLSDSKKQLEIALQIEPENNKYKTAFEKLEQKMNYTAQAAYNEQQATTNEAEEPQMGNDSFCSSCAQCIACNALLNCGLNLCCRC